MSLVRYKQIRRPHFGRTMAIMPATDIIENDDEYLIQVNLPGFSKDEVSIEANHEYIEITAEHKEETEDKKEDNDVKYLHRERRTRKLARRISFAKPIDSTKAETNLDNGVLSIKLPKSEEAKAIKLSIN
ncbi:MAG: Hsp20/alpha crystallin family protein [Candidatus Kariarchaeaceae archaeon]